MIQPSRLRLVLPWLALAAAAAPAAASEPPPAEPPPADVTAPAAPAARATTGIDVLDAGRGLPAHRLTGAVRIDGRLDEHDWAQAGVAGQFTQDAPHHGEPATSPTEVRVLYDDQYLYVGARMHHAPGRGEVTALVHRRDRDSASDWFGVALDSTHDRRTALEFRVNAAGVQRDVLMYADTNSDDSWDALWDSGVTVDADGWTAELRIPISLLRVRAGDGDQRWGINFVRVDQAPQETDRWHVIGRSENAFVSKFPVLTGLTGLRPQSRREIIPYLTTRGKLATAQDFDDRGLSTRAGVDAHLGIGSSSALDLTFLPDFGQTEVDQVILNLSTVETFFPEKRTFFLEGSELFSVTGLRLFYSRRIGRSAPSVNLGPDETVVERPLALDILGAAKFTGKYEGGLNLGALVAETEPAYARVRTASGAIETRQLSSAADSAVVRALQPIGDDGSHIGAFTSLHVERADGGRRAFVGAIDGSWKTADASLQVDGLAVTSAISGPDGNGAYALGRAIKRGAAGWYVSGSGTYVSRRFDPNDLGYLDRPDVLTGRLETGRQWDQTAGAFRNWSYYGSATYGADHTGRAFNKNLDGRLSTGFTNDWSAYLGGGDLLPYYDDRELRTFYDDTKKYLHHDHEPYVTAGAATSASGVWAGSLDLSLSSYVGGPTYTATLTQTIRPSSQLELQLVTDLTDARGELHWLETQGDTPIVGLRKLRQLSQSLRASYAFTPIVSLQAYTQLLLASWNYRDLQSYVDDDTLAPGAMSPTTSFTDHEWNLNAVLRWELRPGSTLFAVYTHSAFNADVFHPDASLSRHALPALWHAPADDVFQVKLSWMFR